MRRLKDNEEDQNDDRGQGHRTQAKIQTRGLNLWFAQKQVLDNIDLDIAQDNITAIMGPSGCGKSTFIRVLNRMNDIIPDCRITGSVLLDGEDVYSPSTDVVRLRTRVGMVFQKPNPFPKSVYDNVAFGPRIQGRTSREDLDRVVEESLRGAALWDEVKERLNESALTLSGGQQQRLCIARALAVKPEVILMDEPCSALDPSATAKIEQLMAELKKNYTVVIVTHNMQQAARVSDYTAFLYLGKLIEYGLTDEIFENPKNKLTENYITGRFG